MSSKRRTQRGKKSSDALTVGNDRSGNSSGQNVDVVTMSTGNSTDNNLSQEVLKAEIPVEDCLHFAGCSHGADSSHRSSDRAYGDVGDSVASLPNGGNCVDDVDGLRNVRKLLMHQIRSFVMDPDIDIFSKSLSHLDDSSLKQGVQNSKENLEIKEATEQPLENICMADSGILDTEAIISKSQSYDHLDTVVDYDKSEHSSNIMTEDWCKCTSESDDNLFDFDISKGKFCGGEGEDFESVLQLLLHIRGICFKTENLSKQESVNVKQFEGLEEANHFTAEHPEVMDDVPSPAATLPANDSSEENSEYVKDRVRCLWKEINEIFERRQFSSAVILRRHLETVEKIKSVADNQCLLQLQRQQQDSKRDSKGAPGNVKFENTKSLEQFVMMLSTKANSNMTYLSGKLIQWQDFNEIQTDLGYELAKELDSLESIEARINSGDTNLKDGQHDLKLVEEMEENYCKKLIKLRRSNRDIDGLLDDETRENHRSQSGTLANQLQYIKMSCSRLRKRLDLPVLPLTNDCLQSEEQKEVCHSVYSQTDDDDDVEVPAPVSLLRMLLLLLMLIVLFLVFFFFFLELRWYNHVRSFRLPVFYHLRHVGTFPPF